MKNLRYEEFWLPSNISKSHEETLKLAECPAWLNIECPYCNKTMPLNSIRSVGLKLNARNLFDIFVEFCCHNCKAGNTLYFKKEVKNFKEFADFITGIKIPQNIPIIEEEMYKIGYNNLIEKMAEDIQTEISLTKVTFEETKEV